jgi:hypothetical protein
MIVANNVDMLEIAAFNSKLLIVVGLQQLHKQCWSLHGTFLTSLCLPDGSMISCRPSVPLLSFISWVYECFVFFFLFIRIPRQFFVSGCDFK